jgi:hypothetical protein
MTAAENLGRSESARRLKQKGIPVEEVWSATHDSRTRETHLLLDGTKRDEKTGKFGVGIIEEPYLRFPADPEGQAKEIYNCRCRLNVQIEGIDHSKDDELYEQFMREQHPEDWEAIQKRREDSKTGEGRRWQERQDALERQQRLRAERQAQPSVSAEEETQPQSIQRGRIEESAFQPASSISDAENYARDNFVEAQFGINFTGQDVSFSGIDLDVANTINRRLNTIYENFSIDPLTSLEAFGKKNIAAEVQQGK